MKIKDIVRVKRTWHSDFYDRYIGCELQGEKGKIVDTIWQNGEIEGYRVKFPAVTIWDHDNKEKLVENFVWPFRKDDIEKADGQVKFRPKRKRRRKKQLEGLIAAAKRLRKRGMKIKDIAKQLEAPSKTIENWLYR